MCPILAELCIGLGVVEHYKEGDLRVREAGHQVFRTTGEGRGEGDQRPGSSRNVSGDVSGNVSWNGMGRISAGLNSLRAVQAAINRRLPKRR